MAISRQVCRQRAAISGEGVPERVLLQVAQDLQREIETLPEILSADMVGNREELLEAIIDPAQLETYGLTNQQIVQAVNNTRLLGVEAEIPRMVLL